MQGNRWFSKLPSFRNTTLHAVTSACSLSICLLPSALAHGSESYNNFLLTQVTARTPTTDGGSSPGPGSRRQTFPRRAAGPPGTAHSCCSRCRCRRCTGRPRFLRAEPPRTRLTTLRRGCTQFVVGCMLGTAMTNQLHVLSAPTAIARQHHAQAIRPYQECRTHPAVDATAACWCWAAARVEQ